MGATLTVACKMPHGLELRLFDMVETTVPVVGGGMRKVKEARQRPETVTIKGYAAEFGKVPAAEVEGGFALTHGVDADFWDAWLAANADSDIVKKGLIFALPTVEGVRSESKNRRSLRNGLEPFAKDGDPRAPRRTSNVTAGAATADA